MSYWKTVLAAGVAAGIAIAATTSLAAMMSVQEKRTAVMKGLGGHMKALSAVAKGEMEASEATVVHAMAIGEIANTVALLFPEGSGGGDSRALPKIWSDWAGFEKAADDLSAAAWFDRSGQIRRQRQNRRGAWRGRQDLRRLSQALPGRKEVVGGARG